MDRRGLRDGGRADRGQRGETQLQPRPLPAILPLQPRGRAVFPSPLPIW